MVEHLLPKHLRLCTRAPYLSWRALERGVIGCGAIRLATKPLARRTHRLRQHLHPQIRLSGLTDANLLKTYSYYQPDEPGEDSGSPIVGWITGNTYYHYDEQPRANRRARPRENLASARTCQDSRRPHGPVDRA